MATPDNLQPVIDKIEKMLPVYRQKKGKALETYLTNVEWNIKKLKEGSLDSSTWQKYTNSDFSNIGLLLAKGEPGQLFAAEFEKQLSASSPKQPEVAASSGLGAATSSPQATASSASSAATGQTNPAGAPFDVKSFLKEKVSKAEEKLQWQTSVVDLFKLMGLDPSLASRKEVASHLGMSPKEIESVGTEDGNELLRTRVVAELAQNTGKLPVGIA
jgi:hypothetical protein